MKKLKNLFFIFFLMFVGVIVVNAEEYSISVTAETGNAGSSLTMKLDGIEDKNSTYFVKFVNEKDQKPTLTGSPYNSDCGVNKGIDSFLSVYVSTEENTKSQNNIYIDDDWYLLNGYTQAYVVKCTTADSCEISAKPINVERPELPTLGQRYQNYLFAGETGNDLSVFPYFPYSGDVGSHEINVKIGLISDNNLLKKLARNQTGSLEELLAYAKNDNGTVFKQKDEDFKDIDIGSFEVINGSYYYMYTYYTNTDNKYRNLEDISVVMGDADMLVNDVEWNIRETEWEKFIASYKESEFIKSYKDGEISFYEDDNKFVITLKQDNNTYEIQFNHLNGIVSYELDSNKTSKEKVLDSYFIGVAIKTFTQKFNYNEEKFNDFLTNNSSLKLDKDGIEYVTDELTLDEDSDSISSNVHYVYYKSIKLDITKGSSTFEKYINEINNPNTGVNMRYDVLILFLILSGFIYLIIRKNSKFPKHN